MGIRHLFFVCCWLACAGAAHAEVVQAETGHARVDKAASNLLLDITHAGSRLVAVGDRGHVLLSDTHGQQWRLASTPDDRLLTAVFFIDANRGWAVGHEALILHTTDGGEHWQVQHDGMTQAAAGDAVSPLLDISFADAQHGWAVGAFGLVLYTGDGGEHWEDRSDRIGNPEGLHLNAVTVLDDGRAMMVGERGFISIEQSNGEWQQQDFPYDGSLFGVQSLAGRVLVYGLRGHAYRQQEGGLWQALPLPLAQTLFGATATDGTVFLVGQGGTVMAVQADDRVRVLQKEQGNHLTAVTQDGDTLWLVGQGGIHALQMAGQPGEQP